MAPAQFALTESIFASLLEAHFTPAQFALTESFFASLLEAHFTPAQFALTESLFTSAHRTANAPRYTADLSLGQT